jgi:hypothetical protein
MVLLSACVVLALAGCGAGATSTAVTRGVHSAPTIVAARASATSRSKPAAPPRATPPPPSYPRVLAAALGSSPITFVLAASWHNQTAVWISRSSSGVALLSFDQRLVELRLHSGTVDAGGPGWRFGPAVLGSERGRLVAEFNGGFKFSTGPAVLSPTDVSAHRWGMGSARSSPMLMGEPTLAPGTRACRRLGSPWPRCART